MDERRHGSEGTDFPTGNYVISNLAKLLLGVGLVFRRWLNHLTGSGQLRTLVGPFYALRDTHDMAGKQDMGERPDPSGSGH